MKIKDIQLHSKWKYGDSHQYNKNGVGHRDNNELAYHHNGNCKIYGIKGFRHNLNGYAEQIPLRDYYDLFGVECKNETEFELLKLKLINLKIID